VRSSFSAESLVSSFTAAAGRLICSTATGGGACGNVLDMSAIALIISPGE
jgi:hypothetical protein